MKNSKVEETERNVKCHRCECLVALFVHGVGMAVLTARRLQAEPRTLVPFSSAVDVEAEMADVGRVVFPTPRTLSTVIIDLLLFSLFRLPRERVMLL